MTTHRSRPTSDRRSGPADPDAPGTVEFRLLGEIEVALDARPLDAGHARQRSVLAALLVDVNRPVPAAQLIDRVWADRPPYRARNTLASYLSRSRQLLADAAGTRISHGPAGYTLVADPMSVDLHRFRALVGRARAAAHPAHAAALYADALGLWRGEPFTAVDTPWFDDVRTSLEAERVAAALDRNDAVLRSGGHADLLVELPTAVRAHPHDERLAGQLMLAEYRSGRLADALATYQRMRDRLLDDLGAEPGPALRRIHQEILTGDAAVPGPSPVVAAPDPAPRDEPAAPPLPRRVTTFVGRRSEVEQVVTAVRDDPLVTLTGVGGVGKTRLALEAAGTAHRFGDGVWLCELAPVEDTAAVSHAVAAALRLQQRPGRTIEQTVVDYCADRELLLILDNCEHVLDAAAQLVGRLVRHCPKVAVLATSREPLGVDGERILAVDPLPAADAAALFADRARTYLPDLRLDDQAADAVAAICRRLDGLPLGIELAAARTRVMNATEVADRLAANVRIVSGGPRDAPTRHRSLVAAVEWSYRLLSQPDRALFERLSVFAGGFDLEAAHGVCGADDSTDDTLDLLVGLVDKSMVAADRTPGTTRYRMLETIRQYARERLDERGELDEIRRRHARYWADLVERAAEGLRGPDEAVWVERLVPSYDDLRGAVRWAISTEDTDLSLRLVAVVPEFTYARVGFESADWSGAALALPGAHTHRLAPAAYGGAATAAWCRGDFERAVQLVRDAGEPEWVEACPRSCQPLDVLACVAFDTGRAPDAIAHFKRQVDRARTAGDPVRLNWALWLLSAYRARVDDLAGARPAAEEALAVARASGNPTSLSLGLLAVGYILMDTEPDRALSLLDESAAAAESVQNRWWAGFARMEAAGTRAAHADPVAAADALVDVLDDWDRLGDRNQVWRCLHHVTSLLVRLGAAEDPVVLHHAVLAAGRPAPLDPARLENLAEALGAERFDAAARRGSNLDVTAALALARPALHRATAT